MTGTTSLLIEQMEEILDVIVVDGKHNYVPFEDVKTIIREHETETLIQLRTAANAIIGYCQSLEVGAVITEPYVARMNEHYIPKLEAAFKTCASSYDQ